MIGGGPRREICQIHDVDVGLEWLGIVSHALWTFGGSTGVGTWEGRKANVSRQGHCLETIWAAKWESKTCYLQPRRNESDGVRDERQTTRWGGTGTGKEVGSRSSEGIGWDEAYPSKKLRIPSLNACHGGLC